MMGLEVVQREKLKSIFRFATIYFHINQLKTHDEIMKKPLKLIKTIIQKNIKYSPI